MVLKMARPQRHPTTGIYQFRKRVPDHLIPIVGKREVKASLKTRDPKEAVIAHARMLAEIEARWRQLSVGLISLSQKQAVAMAGEIYREMVSTHDENPGEPRKRRADMLIDYAHLRPDLVRTVQMTNRDDLFALMVDHIKNRRNDGLIQNYLDRHGYRLDEESTKLLKEAVATAVLQAKEHILRLSEGDYSPDPKAGRFPELDLTPKTQMKADSGKHRLVQIFEDYATEKEVAPGTRKRWKSIIVGIAAEVPDARDLTRQWVIDYKDRLIKQGLAPKTVQEANLAALKATCNWGVTNARLDTNPATGVSVSVPREIKTRPKHFTAEEARTILRATMIPASKQTSKPMRAAYRWVPWLCAYTGARVGEITQLRKQDVQQHEGKWLIWVTPEAGTTKNKQSRCAALHDHLVEQGFLDFVSKAKSGPLFYNPGLHRGGTEGNPQYKKAGERLGTWVRELGVDDERISPNHAWRHLFKTKARSVHMDVGARNYMQGHAPGSEGEAYGEFEPHLLAHEINKLPRFAID